VINKNNKDIVILRFKITHDITKLTIDFINNLGKSHLEWNYLIDILAVAAKAVNKAIAEAISKSIYIAEKPPKNKPIR
jgi:hypothetical protein